MKRRIILSGQILVALFLVALFQVSGVNGGTVNDQSEATFVVR